MVRGAYADSTPEPRLDRPARWKPGTLLQPRVGHQVTSLSASDDADQASSDIDAGPLGRPGREHVLQRHRTASGRPITPDPRTERERQPRASDRAKRRTRSHHQAECIRRDGHGAMYPPLDYHTLPLCGERNGPADQREECGSARPPDDHPSAMSYVMAMSEFRECSTEQYFWCERSTARRAFASSSPPPTSR